MDKQLTEEQELDQELDNMTGEEDYDEAFDEAVAELKGEHEESGQQHEEAPPTQTESQEPAGNADQFEVDKYVEAQNAPAEEAIPQGWAGGNQALQDAWGSLPAGVKAEVRRREEDRTKLMRQEVNKTQELQRQLEPMMGVANELSPMLQKWALEEKPLSLHEGIRQGVALREYIKDTSNVVLAKQFKAAAMRQGATEADFEDTPQDMRSQEIQSLRDEVKSLTVGKEESEATATQDAQTAQRNQLSSQVMQRYYAFAETLNVNGQPKYPTASNEKFATIMGSQIAARVHQFPGTPVDEHIKAVYSSMNGQILDGSEIRHSNNTQQLRTAATSGYAKGRGSTPSPTLFDNHDDAWNATLEEYGLLDE